MACAEDEINEQDSADLFPNDEDGSELEEHILKDL
jgi:hypothetical protein